VTGVALLVLRLVLASVLVAHGAHDLFGTFGEGGGLTASAAYFTKIGFTQGYVIALVAGLLQFVGGMLIAIGLLSRWISLALIGFYGLLVWREHAKWGFFLNWTNDPTRGHGMEFAVLMSGALLSLIIAGAGEWSLDGRRAQSRESRIAGRARIRNR
jgi:putative oxidoreductase